MSEVRVVLAGAQPAERSVPTGTTAAELFADDRTAVVARVNGELRDLATCWPTATSSRRSRSTPPDGLAVLRHSTAHVMAQAVQELFPQARLGIGPPIKDGFYYDFDVARAVPPGGPRAASRSGCRRSSRQGQRFSRRVVTDDDARAELAAEPYKLELIGLKGSGAEATPRERRSRSAAGELTIYDNLDRGPASWRWKDLCRGPHLPTHPAHPGLQADAHRPRAYWRGSEKNPQLQRIYGTAWPSRDALKAHLDLPGRGREARPPQARRRAGPVLLPRGDRLRAGRSSTPRAASSAGRWRTTRRRAARGGRLRVRLHPAHHQGGRCSRPPATWTGTPTACTRRWSSTGRAQGRTTTSSR